MPDYRAYTVGTNGNFMKVLELIASSDDEAVDAARAVLDGYDIEVWQRDRKITILKGSNSTK